MKTNRQLHKFEIKKWKQNYMNLKEDCRKGLSVKTFK